MSDNNRQDNNGAMDTVQIMHYLPHRPPFLLIDKLTSSSGIDWAEGVKYLSAGDFFFDGHFPGRPQMPKSLLLEVIAQAGAAGVLSAPEYQGKYILFASIDKCRFGRAAVPGDVLEIRTELISMKPRPRISATTVAPGSCGRKLSGKYCRSLWNAAGCRGKCPLAS